MSTKLTVNYNEYKPNVYDDPDGKGESSWSETGIVDVRNIAVTFAERN